MILTDTGPLVAILDQRQNKHSHCRDTALSLPLPMLTTWPCFTEVMHFASKAQGWNTQEKVWEMLRVGNLIILDLDARDRTRMAMLMEKYQDTPMDLADASLVVAAEKLKLKRVFTLDSDFLVYRLQAGSTLELIK